MSGSGLSLSLFTGGSTSRPAQDSSWLPPARRGKGVGQAACGHSGAGEATPERV